MNERIYSKSLKHIEISAYILALWSFTVLFLEPIISFHLNYRLVENLTAVANITFLILTIVNRLLLDGLQRNRNIILFDLIMLVLGSLLMIYQAKFVIFFLLIRQTYFILQLVIFNAFDGRLYKFLSNNPPTTLMVSFFIVIIIGSLLLMLPAASAANSVTPFVDALFTSTSATCVTGLIVYDTGTHFSTFGQMVILVLIQVGGLGIMTISTAFALILGQRLNLKLENIMHSVVGGASSINLFRLLKNIVIVTVLIEAVGALFLYSTFINDFDPIKAAYLSVFHSISAFCNAGFSLLPDSFVQYVGNPVAMFSLSVLIILGGLGFTVLIDLYRYMFGREKVRHLTLHTKLVLLTSAVLLALGFFAYLIAEYYYTMDGFSVSERLLGSWFQSVTTRTAGFNSIEISNLSPASVLLTYILMFIGGSPGSTSGGIKTTTFALLILSVTAMLKGRRELSVFNRRIALSNFRESASLVTISVFIVLSISFIIMLVEPIDFEKILFEAISAFGTVGLSMGITADLTIRGKLLITVLMFIGRIGPLTMIYAFAIKKQATNINYAEEKLAIG